MKRYGDLWSQSRHDCACVYTSVSMKFEKMRKILTDKLLVLVAMMQSSEQIHNIFQEVNELSRCRRNMLEIARNPLGQIMVRSEKPGLMSITR